RHGFTAMSTGQIGYEDIVFNTHLPPAPPLFPYTTLFRSVLGHPCLPQAPAAGDPSFATALVPDASGARSAALGLPRTHLPREPRSEEHTSELQSRENLVCRLLLEKKKKYYYYINRIGRKV